LSRKSNNNIIITEAFNYDNFNKEIRERIFTAADELYATSKDREYPRIEDVRQLSRAGMNTVAEVMKEWQQKRKQVQTIIEPIPADLQVVLQEMGQEVYGQLHYSW